MPRLARCFRTSRPMASRNAAICAASFCGMPAGLGEVFFFGSDTGSPCRHELSFMHYNAFRWPTQKSSILDTRPPGPPYRCNEGKFHRVGGGGSEVVYGQTIRKPPLASEYVSVVHLPPNIETVRPLVFDGIKVGLIERDGSHGQCCEGTRIERCFSLYQRRIHTFFVGKNKGVGHRIGCGSTGDPSDHLNGRCLAGGLKSGHDFPLFIDFKCRYGGDDYSRQVARNLIRASRSKAMS